jgi:site-specific DNA recombinase
MFGMYAEGAGLRLIADTLTAEGVPSPAAYNRRRNPHREPRGWAHTAVRAILANPIYGGRKVWGKQQRHEELLDVTDVAAGHVTRMRWRPDSHWIAAETNTTPPLVDPGLAERVAARFGHAPTRTKLRDAKHSYLLRGLLYCGICGRKLQGSARPARTPGLPTRVLYRCEFGTHRSVPAGLDHPPMVYVREDAVVPRLDAWLAEIVTPEALAAAQAPPPGAGARDAAIKAATADCDLRIDRLMNSVEEAGMPMEWISRRIVELRNERDRLEKTLPDRSSWRPLSAGEIRAMANALGGLIAALRQANPADRAAVYAELGLKLTYEPAANQVRAEVDLARVGRGVGGPRRTRRPRRFSGPSWRWRSQGDGTGPCEPPRAIMVR